MLIKNKIFLNGNYEYNYYDDSIQVRYTFLDWAIETGI